MNGPRYKPYDWKPLTMTRQEVAHFVFRRAESWFIDHVPEGFPAPVDGLYATQAVEDWVRVRHGLQPDTASPEAAERRMLARIAVSKGPPFKPRVTRK